MQGSQDERRHSGKYIPALLLAGSAPQTVARDDLQKEHRFLLLLVVQASLSVKIPSPC